MSRRFLKHLLSFALALALGAAALWLREDAPRGPVAPPRAPAPGRGPGITWVELQQPVLAADPANDGDSFLIRHTGGAHIMRLYFVDCPEKRRNQFNRERLADQGAYFGGLAEADVVRLGRAARDYTLKLLAGRPFRAFTHWEPVFDERRHYAHLAVIMPDGRERWLADLLVEQGLARIFTRGAALPDGTSNAAVHQQLVHREKEARLHHRGGWKDAAGGVGDPE